jgi:hypothetical protein
LGQASATMSLPGRPPPRRPSRAALILPVACTSAVGQRHTRRLLSWDARGFHFRRGSTPHAALVRGCPWLALPLRINATRAARQGMGRGAGEAQCCLQGCPSWPRRAGRRGGSDWADLRSAPVAQVSEPLAVPSALDGIAVSTLAPTHWWCLPTSWSRAGRAAPLSRAPGLAREQLI